MNSKGLDGGRELLAPTMGPPRPHVNPSPIVRAAGSICRGYANTIVARPPPWRGQACSEGEKGVPFARLYRSQFVRALYRTNGGRRKPETNNVVESVTDQDFT